MAQEAKRGGPYNKNAQKDRRKKVYELHFEKGYPAVKIAQELNVNRNTINSDIEYWYDRIASFDEMVNPERGVVGALERMNLRRIQLMELHKTATTINEKIQIKKTVNDIDYRVAQIHIRLAATSRKMFNFIYSQINQILKEENIDREYVTVLDKALKTVKRNDEADKKSKQDNM